MRGIWLTALATLIVSAAMAGEERAVTYRVTYGSGIVADVLTPPDTDAGIKSVLRIVAVPGAVTLSTGDEGSDAPGKLTITPLSWDGKAWTLPAPAPTTRRAADKAQAEDDLVASEIRKTEQLLQRMIEGLKSLDHAVAEAQRKVDSLAGGEEMAAKAAAANLADLQRQRDSMLKAVESYRERLTALEKLAKEDAFAKPAGRVTGSRLPASAPAAQAAVKADAPAHHVQVTRLAPGTGRRTYRVSLPHAEAGAAGAFYFVAYADTDGDGVPDKLIARSALAQSVLAGGWSTWTFTTSERNVFAGNAWVADDVALSERPPQGEAAGSVKQEYFVSGFFGKAPQHKRAFVPYLQDLRIEIPQDSSGESMDSEIIVK